MFSHFLSEQEFAYPIALYEMRRGRKMSHWIWYIFPQVAGLTGKPSFNTQRYAIADLAMAKAYLSHPVLGARLRQISACLLEHEGKTALDVMSSGVDVRKLQSCMTLFDLAGEGRAENAVFSRVLALFYAGERDGKTIRIIKEQEERRRN